MTYFGVKINVLDYEIEAGAFSLSLKPTSPSVMPPSYIELLLYRVFNICFWSLDFVLHFPRIILLFYKDVVST